MKTQLLQTLTSVLQEINYYVQIIDSLGDCTTPVEAPNPNHSTIHCDRRPSGKHVRRDYGPQFAKNVAIIFRAEYGSLGRQAIVICRRGQRRQTGSERFDTVPITDRLYGHLTYIYFLPLEMGGKHPSLPLSCATSKRQRASEMFLSMFYAYQLSQCPNQLNTLLCGGRLFQQYVENQYYKEKSKRLKYLKCNQTALRASDYTLNCEQLEDSQCQKMKWMLFMVAAFSLFQLLTWVVVATCVKICTISLKS